MNWCLYREKWGSLHIGMRIDRATARGIANYMSSISKSRTFALDDFSPFDKKASQVDIDDVDSVFAALKGLAS